MSELVRNSAKLLSAHVLAQVVGLIIYPILTRLYAPEDFGLLNLFLSLAGILTLVATAEYQSAIVLPSERDKAIAIFRLGLYVCATVCAVLVVSGIFARPIACLLGAPDFCLWYRLLPIFVGTMGCWSLLNSYYTRTKRFGEIATYQVSQSGLSAVGKIGLGYAAAGGWGLLGTTVVVPVLNLLGTISRLFHHACDEGRALLLTRVERSQLREVAVEYANFPKFVLPRSLINTLGGNLPALLLTPYFGLAELGFFAMAMTLVFRPIGMFTSAIHQTMYQRVSEAVREGQSILPLFRKYLLTMGGLVLLLVPIYICTPQLVCWLLGERWEETATLVRVMIPWCAMVLVVGPMAYLSDVFMVQKWFCLIEIGYLLLRIGAMVVGVIQGSFLTAISLLSTVGVMTLMGQLMVYFYLILRYENAPERGKKEKK